MGEGLLTGEEDPLGEPILRRMDEDMVFLAACLARSVLTKLETRSSRLPLRLGDARSSRGSIDSVLGLAEMWVMLEPRWGDSRVEEEGEEKEEWRGEESEEGSLPPLSRLW